MFSPETYIQRRQELKKSMGSGLILLLGNKETGINFSDNWYPFRQDSNFLYYLGLKQPGMVTVLDCDSGEEILFGDDLTMDEIVWCGPQPSIAEQASATGIRKTLPYDQLGHTLARANALRQTIHFCPPYRDQHLIELSELLGRPLYQIKNGASKELILAIAAQRNIKSREELAEIEKAVTLTGDMHLAAMRVTRPGMKEYEIASIVQQTAVSGGGQLAFPIILTRDGQTLHNHYHGNAIQEGDMVLCDAGAETSMGYCGDMTRTFPAGKQFSAQQKELYQIVLNAHETAIDLLKPGIEFKEVHLKACEALFEGLKSLGLTKGDTKQAVAEGAHALFFQCGLGHLMGLDVHDMENLGEQYVGHTASKSTEFGLKSLRLGRKLEPGFVLTVEPGLYFIPTLIDQWKAEKRHESYLNYSAIESLKNSGGIRIEDNFAITESSARLLGHEVPRTVEGVEGQRAF